MIHLRLHKSAIKTFCDMPVTLSEDPRKADRFSCLGNAVEDPREADCVPCLGNAVAFHEREAKIAENRLCALASQPLAHVICHDSCDKGCIFNPCRKPYAP